MQQMKKLRIFKLKQMKYRDFEWIRRIINSCETFTQLRTPITRLITLFSDKYEDYQLTNLLQNYRENHELYKK